MVDVVLIYPPYTWPRKNPPLGLAYLAACLERAGYRVKIIDMSPLGLDSRALSRVLRGLEFKIAGISFMTPQANSARQIAGLIKAIDGNIPVMAGGPHASALPEEVLREKSVDFVVRGEGETTTVELVNSLLAKKDNYEDIKGLAFGRADGIYLTPAREMITDLDRLPFPAWHLLPYKRYSVSRMGIDVARPVFALVSSRGCPNNCIFCDSHTVFGRRFRQRSAANIFAEIRHLNERFAGCQFDFVDDLITVNAARLQELCDLIIASGMNIAWTCNARVNTVNFGLLQKMKAAGCRRIDFGVESGDERVLKAIRKNISIEQVRNAFLWARQAGLKTTAFLMVGNVGEDWNSVQKTAALAQELKCDNPGVSVATPFPGTDLYRLARERGWLYETDWEKYVTAPYILPGYKPVMRTDKMTRGQILNAYYYLNARFMRQKFRTKYGRLFFFNPYFYLDGIFKINSFKDLLSKFSAAGKLIRRLFKS